MSIQCGLAPMVKRWKRSMSRTPTCPITAAKRSGRWFADAITSSPPLDPPCTTSTSPRGLTASVQADLQDRMRCRRARDAGSFRYGLVLFAKSGHCLEVDIIRQTTCISADLNDGFAWARVALGMQMLGARSKVIEDILLVVQGTCASPTFLQSALWQEPQKLDATREWHRQAHALTFARVISVP